MEERFLPPFITLITCAITCTICIVMKYEVVESLKIIFWVLIIFYIIGLVATKIIFKTLGMNEEKVVDKAENGEDIDNEKKDLEEDNLQE